MTEVNGLISESGRRCTVDTQYEAICPMHGRTSCALPCNLLRAVFTHPYQSFDTQSLVTPDSRLRHAQSVATTCIVNFT